MNKIVIFGANSAIAQAAARRLGDRGHQLYLVGRSSDKLKAVTDDLWVRNIKVAGSRSADLNDCSLHKIILAGARQAMNGLDTILIAYGDLGDQKSTEASFESFKHVMETNFLSQSSILTLAANEFEQQGSGTLAVISSVAGDRGRGSNYAYGTAKGAMTIFLSGLRNRLFRKGVRVITIKPGLVDTPMTRGFKKGPLWASPERVGHSIAKSIENGRDIVYIPGFWRPIMAIIRTIPEVVFKRLGL